MTPARARRLTRTGFQLAALAFTIAGGILTAISHPADGAILLAVAVACVSAAWLIGVPAPQGPQSPPWDYQDWRVDLEVARFRGQISEWEAAQRSQQ